MPNDTTPPQIVSRRLTRELRRAGDVSRIRPPGARAAHPRAPRPRGQAGRARPLRSSRVARPRGGARPRAGHRPRVRLHGPLADDCPAVRDYRRAPAPDWRPRGRLLGRRRRRAGDPGRGRPTAPPGPAAAWGPAPSRVPASRPRWRARRGPFFGPGPRRRRRYTRRSPLTREMRLTAREREERRNRRRTPGARMPPMMNRRAFLGVVLAAPCAAEAQGREQATSLLPDVRSGHAPFDTVRRVLPGLAGLGLRRGADRHDRLSFGGWTRRALARPRRRMRAAQHRHHRRNHYAVRSGCEERNAQIPIVMLNLGDPVGTGLVDSLGRPGGNITGVTSMSPGLSAKRLELLKAPCLEPRESSYSHISSIRLQGLRSRNSRSQLPRWVCSCRFAASALPQTFRPRSTLVPRNAQKRSSSRRRASSSFTAHRSPSWRPATDCRRYTRTGRSATPAA